MDYQFFYTSHRLNWLSWLFCWKLGCLIPLSGSSRSLLHVYPSKYAKERTLYTVECNTEKSLCISTMLHTILCYQWKIWLFLWRRGDLIMASICWTAFYDSYISMSTNNHILCVAVCYAFFLIKKLVFCYRKQANSLWRDHHQWTGSSSS